MYKTGILTLSDKGAKGQRTDLSGPQISEILASTSLYQVVKTEILPDDQESIKAKLIEWADRLLTSRSNTGSDYCCL
jgi:molybdopterin biosynthesis enzyme MoaB